MGAGGAGHEALGLALELAAALDVVQTRKVQLVHGGDRHDDPGPGWSGLYAVGTVTDAVGAVESSPITDSMPRGRTSISHVASNVRAEYAVFARMATV